ncbi:hypothetical protein FOA52_000397 [Chlamydomonas sp. UWO 241]|nr:hypothetical protein FOA52_000397 [Chlamydomonas sp. UWO 241]
MKTLELGGVCAADVAALKHAAPWLTELRLTMPASADKGEGKREMRDAMRAVLASCGKLTSLQVDRSKSKRLECLGIGGGCANRLGAQLEKLDLSSSASNLCNLSGLAHCKRLRDLDLREGAALTSLGPLGACTQLMRLWLDGCRQLTSIKPLTQCVQLRNLSLSRCSGLHDLCPLTSCCRLASLDLDYCGISDLGPVGFLTALTYLSFNACGLQLGIPVSSLEPLSSCLKLQSLDLSQTAVYNLLPLSALTRLTHLDCSDTVVISNIFPSLGLSDRRHLRGVSRSARTAVDYATRKLTITWQKEKGDTADKSRQSDILGARSRLSNVSSLTLRHMPTDVLLVALSPVLGFPAFDALRSLRVEMKTLELGGVSAADVAALKHAGPWLTELRLTMPVSADKGEGMREMRDAMRAVLASCGKLTSLQVDRSKSKRLECLGIGGGYANRLGAQLEKLDLSSSASNLRNLSGLAHCKRLRDLDLSEGAALASLGPLSACTQLSRLWLDGCRQLTSIKPLTQCVQLHNLSLSRCSSLRDLRPLTSCRRLATLDLDYCGISDLGPVGFLTALTRLSFSGCAHQEWDIPVSSLEPLSSCLKLRFLDLSQTDVDDLLPISALTRLTHLDCSETGVYSLRALRGCTGLRSLIVVGSCVHPMELARSGGWSKLETLVTDEGEFYGDSTDESDDSGDDEADHDSDATVAPSES